MKKNLDKASAKQHAEILMQKYQSTTVIDVKNRLHTAGFKSFRQDVEKLLLEIAEEEEWQVIRQGNDNILFKLGEDTNEFLHIFLANANNTTFLEVQIEEEFPKVLWIRTPSEIKEQRFSSNRKAVQEMRRLLKAKKEEGLVESSLPNIRISSRKLWQPKVETLFELEAGFFNVLKTTEAQTLQGEFLNITFSVGGLFRWKKDSQASTLIHSPSTVTAMRAESFSAIKITGSKLINIHWQEKSQNPSSEFVPEQYQILSESFDFSQAKQYELSLYFTDAIPALSVNIFDNIEKDSLQELKALIQETDFN